MIVFYLHPLIHLITSFLTCAFRSAGKRNQFSVSFSEKGRHFSEIDKRISKLSDQRLINQLEVIESAVFRNGLEDKVRVPMVLVL